MEIFNLKVSIKINPRRKNFADVIEDTPASEV